MDVSTKKSKGWIKLKKTLISILSTFFILFSLNSIASAAKPIQLNVNGALLTDLAAPLIKNSISYVPIRTVQSLGYKVNWDSRSKTVLIINKATSDRLSLVINSDVAMMNDKKLDLDRPPLVKGNTVYVPLRFISENFGVLVDWDSKNNGIVLVSPDPETQTQIKSGDLAKARLAVAGMPRVQFYISTVRPESHSYSYIFNEKDYSKFYFILGDSIYYYEMKNGYMSIVWEAQMAASNQKNSSSPLAKFLDTGIDTLWGRQPELTSRLVYFEDEAFVYDKGEYGIVGMDGSVEFSKTVVNPKKFSDILINFPEEN
jgi:hypothetical protein